jgi:uncharacterized protein (TIGR02453 family)
LQFYEGLQADNSKTYWAAHQQVYDEMVLGPMTALLAELKSEFGQGKVFRPNRDVRFSADKSPYKLHIGATVGLSYIQLSAKGLAAASGMHRMATDQLDRYRHAVADEQTGTDLEQIIGDVQRHAIDVHGQHSLKTTPKGYSTDHPRLALLQHKGPHGKNGPSLDGSPPPPPRSESPASCTQPSRSTTGSSLMLTRPPFRSGAANSSRHGVGPAVVANQSARGRRRGGRARPARCVDRAETLIVATS